MSKLYTEQGFLSEYGEEAFAKFLDIEIVVILNSAKTEGELTTLGCLISKRVGDLVSHAKHKSVQNRLEKWSKTEKCPKFINGGLLTAWPFSGRI